MEAFRTGAKSGEHTVKWGDEKHNLLIVHLFSPGYANGKTRYQIILIKIKSLYNFHNNLPLQLHYLFHEKKTSFEDGSCSVRQ
jgi:hypothetical protein